MKRKGDGWFFFLFVLLMFSAMFDDDELVKVVIVQDTSEIVQELSDSPHYEIGYEIEYGSAYTGDQSPIITRGTFVLDGEFFLGSNGLPTTDFIPSHLAIDFQPWKGAHYTLHVPTCCSEPASLLTSKDNYNRIPMVATVEQRDGQVFVKACPLTSHTL